jgi:hypothetical protein
MSQIFHRSANTIARVSIFGAVFFIAGLLGLFAEVNRSPWVTDARVARDGDPVQPRAPRRRQRRRLPLLPHFGRRLVVRRHPADSVHELPLPDFRQRPVPRAGGTASAPAGRSVDARPRSADFAYFSHGIHENKGRLHRLPRQVACR